MLEVVGGRRASVQLDGVVSASVLRYVRAARGVGGGVVVLRSLRLSFPADQVVEAAALVGAAGRVRAVAARFEHADAGWRCVAFRILFMIRSPAAAFAVRGLSQRRRGTP